MLSCKADNQECICCVDPCVHVHFSACTICDIIGSMVQHVSGQLCSMYPVCGLLLLLLFTCHASWSCLNDVVGICGFSQLKMLVQVTAAQMLSAVT